MSRKLIIGTAVAIVLLGAIWWSVTRKENATVSRTDKTVAALRDVHGLAVDKSDPSKVYIATHNGLLVLEDDKKLASVGESSDDYMGFTAHPTDANTLYTSGHGRQGGNLGFQKSSDYGKTWQKLSDGANGPVDFHTLAISQFNPNFVYGWYAGQLQRSNNEGGKWDAAPVSIQGVRVLATSPSIERTIWAGTGSGLMVSNDFGTSWQNTGLNSAVTSLAAHPKNDQELIAYSQDEGLIKSADGAKTWQKLDGYASASPVLYLAYDTRDPEVIYGINQQLEIFKSADSGQSWRKVFPNN